MRAGFQIAQGDSVTALAKMRHHLPGFGRALQRRTFPGETAGRVRFQRKLIALREVRVQIINAPRKRRDDRQMAVGWNCTGKFA